MTIACGNRIPSATLHYLRDGVQAIRSEDLFAGKSVLLFAVPGAFTPICSDKHLPGYITRLEAFRARASISWPAWRSTMPLSWKPGRAASMHRRTS